MGKTSVATEEPDDDGNCGGVLVIVGRLIGIKFIPDFFGF
jgi:hypothetical protein